MGAVVVTHRFADFVGQALFNTLVAPLPPRDRPPTWPLGAFQFEPPRENYRIVGKEKSYAIVGEKSYLLGGSASQSCHTLSHKNSNRLAGGLPHNVFGALA
jgi:hypothetical protein